MGYFLPDHLSAVRFGTNLAERIVCKELSWDTRGVYDISTLAASGTRVPSEGIFAQLLRVEREDRRCGHHYRVCLQDAQILGFINRNPDIDLVSFITFIMTHELLHVHRFATGQADFFGESREEEVLVDSLTRVFLARNPVLGLKKVLSLLDKLAAAPLYNHHIVQGDGRYLNAHL